MIGSEVEAEHLCSPSEPAYDALDVFLYLATPAHIYNAHSAFLGEPSSDEVFAHSCKFGFPDVSHRVHERLARL
ncbi:hypothetical protein D3C87_1804310 [compost metagenome]